MMTMDTPAPAKPVKAPEATDDADDDDDSLKEHNSLLLQMIFIN
jgi:hypothetical protein